MAKKKVIVISLGGSLIVPREIDVKFLEKFRDVIKSNTNKYKFIVVCGGGSVARHYIEALRKNENSVYMQNLAGIAITRMNARFMSYFFEKDPDKGIPQDMLEVKGQLRRNDVVFCGALRYAPNQTSDSTSAKLAAFFDCDFVNLTNVKGLYSKDPKLKGAKFIPRITHQDFYDLIMKIESKPGMHAPVDHTAVKIIKSKKVRLFIMGKDTNNFNRFLKAKDFIGTIVG